MLWHLSQRDDWFPEVEGIPRPEWDLIGGWIDQQVPEADHGDAYTQVAKEWLTRLGRALPGEYRVEETDSFLVLTAQSERDEKLLTTFAETSRARVAEILKDVTTRDVAGKDVLLVIENEEDYYHYASHFYPTEGEFGASNGMYVPDGYGHFLVWNHELSDMEANLAYQLSHAWLETLPVPEWLDRGLCLTLESELIGRDQLWMDDELKEAHLSSWNEESIQGLWTGGIFYLSEEWGGLADGLAEILVRFLLEDRDKFRRFLKEAHYEDGGEEATNTVYERGLGTFVESFLGDGEWSPDPEVLSAYFEAGEGE